MEDKNKELKVHNLTNLRTSLIAVITVLTGGITGIILTDINTLKIVILLLIGSYFDLLFLRNVLAVNEKINLILKEN